MINRYRSSLKLEVKLNVRGSVIQRLLHHLISSGLPAATLIDTIANASSAMTFPATPPSILPTLTVVFPYFSLNGSFNPSSPAKARINICVALFPSSGYPECPALPFALIVTPTPPLCPLASFSSVGSPNMTVSQDNPRSFTAFIPSPPFLLRLQRGVPNRHQKLWMIGGVIPRL